MAGRFARGGRLLAFGSGCAAADAAHVVVEFAHPVIVGKRALPAMRLADPGAVGLFGAPDDIALGIAADDDAPVAAGLAAAAWGCSPSHWPPQARTSPVSRGWTTCWP